MKKAELTEGGKAVREIYTRYRRMFQKRYRAGDRWNTFFNTLSDILGKEGINPDTYIKTLFDMVHPLPQPNQTYSNRVMAMYKSAVQQKSVRTSREEAIARLNVELRWYASRERLGVAPEAILSLPSAPFSAAFRWYMARRCGLGALAAACADHAARELANDDVRAVYAHVLGDSV